MAVHYSQPKGFVGRNICYAVMFDGVYYGGIVGGSSTLHLVGRDAFFGLCKENKKWALRRIVNNIFYHIEPVGGRYPKRNFAQAVLKEFRKQIAKDWDHKYGEPVIGYESLVELPRTGEIYRRDGWTEVGITEGFTCKRTAGQGTDSWTGKRVWDTENRRPKRVFVKINKECGLPIHSYKCPNNHETELITLSISQAPIPTVPCKECDLTAKLVEFSQTAPPNMPAGCGGFYSPSQIGPVRGKHDITKLIGQRKAGDREH